MRTIICSLLFLFSGLFALAQSGSITNIQISQRTDGSGLVDVFFDLNGEANAYNILVEISFDGGNNYTSVPGDFLEGNTGPVSPGEGNQITWNGHESFPDTYSTEAMLKIIATAISSGNNGGDGAWPRDTDTEVVEVTNPETGKTWMDRNLGASRAATSSTDSEAYGDLYQWGRAADGHQKRNSATTSTLSSSDTPGHGNFITAGSGSDYDWRSPQNDNLWQGVNGTNNPCPAGYRLPTEAELDAERQSWGSNNSAGAFGSPLKLPVAGSRYYSNGSLFVVGSLGYYWSSTVDGSLSRGLLFYSSNASMGSYYRAYGFSVRCLKDD